MTSESQNRRRPRAIEISGDLAGRRRRWFVSSGAVSAAPAGLLIETLLIATNAIPTNMMQSIVIAD
jgi:hypothetical protein